MRSTYMANLNHARCTLSRQNHQITWVQQSYEKRGCAIYQPLRLEKPSNFRLGFAVGQPRELNGENGAAAGIVVDVDGAEMRGDNSLDDRQAKASASRTPAVA